MISESERRKVLGRTFNFFYRSLNRPDTCFDSRLTHIMTHRRHSCAAQWMSDTRCSRPESRAKLGSTERRGASCGQAMGTNSTRGYPSVTWGPLHCVGSGKMAFILLMLYRRRESLNSYNFTFPSLLRPTNRFLSNAFLSFVDLPLLDQNSCLSQRILEDMRLFSAVQAPETNYGPLYGNTMPSTPAYLS